MAGERAALLQRLAAGRSAVAPEPRRAPATDTPATTTRRRASGRGWRGPRAASRWPSQPAHHWDNGPRGRGAPPRSGRYRCRADSASLWRRRAWRDTGPGRWPRAHAHWETPGSGDTPRGAAPRWESDRSLPAKAARRRPARGRLETGAPWQRRL